MSLGKIKRCLRELLDKGILKMQNFQRSKREFCCIYLITPVDIAAKTALIWQFVKRKIEEYALLNAEIEALPQGIAENGTK